MSKETDNLQALFDLEAGLASQGPLIPPSGSAEPRRGSGAFAHYMRVVRRRAWLLAAFVAVSVLATWVMSANLQPAYEATVTISVDGSGRSVAAGAEPKKVNVAAQEVDRDIATQLRIILSDPVLRPVARKYGLLEREHQFSGLSREGIAALQNSPTVLRGLTVSRVRDAYLIQISYRSADPQVSADVANDIARSYFQQLDRFQLSEARSTSGLVVEELDALKARMERSSQALTQYETANQKNANAGQRSAQLNAEHASAEADRAKAEAAWNAVKAGSPDAMKAFGGADRLERLQERLNEAQEKSADIKASEGPGHPDYLKQQAQVQEIQWQYDAAQGDITAKAEAAYRKAVTREEQLQRDLAQARRVESGHANLDSADYQRLKQEADTDKQLYEEMAAKTQEAAVDSGGGSKNTAIADPARPPLKPAFPNVALNLVLAGVVSLLLGVGGVVAVDSLDGALRDPDDVRRLIGSEVIGSLPQVRDPQALGASGSAPAAVLRASHARPGIRKASAGDELSSFDEAIRMLRNSIVLTDAEGRLHSLLFTSTADGEGKTTVAMHLAMAHAEQGKKTLLVDADLRNPTLDKRLGITEGGPGIAGILGGETTWDEAVVQAPYLPNLYLLPAGSPAANLPELVGSNLAEIIEAASSVYDLVIVDARPIVGFSEPMLLAVAVDGVVMIAAAGKTNRKAAALAVATLHKLRANLLGVVLNRVGKASA